jgi:hypothetical protein
MTEITYRFSGHQTFPLRIAWLPKAAEKICQKRDPLSNPDDGILHLGLGKNMVEALKCWIEAYRIAEREEGKWKLTPIGDLVFGEGALDPYLEDSSTPWLLHWLISTNRKSPFWAWECLFNRWSSTEFCASTVLDAFKRQSDQTPKPNSPVTLKQHWEVFLHTYRPPRSDAGDDNLDSALAVLSLIQTAGERPNAAGKWETLYAFDTGPKKTLPQQLFAFFLHDWWTAAFPEEETVPFRAILNSNLSPGRILKIQETELTKRLADLAAKQPQAFQVVESTNLRQLRRLRRSRGMDDLKAAYRSPRFI